MNVRRAGICRQWFVGRWMTVALLAAVAGVVSGCSSGSGGTGKSGNPPVAAVSGPKGAAVGVAVIFSAANSYDPQGQALTYNWTFGDGATGAGQGVEHAYTQPGTYTVTVTVSDTAGLTGTATLTVTVESVAMAPVANAGGPYTGYLATPLTFNGSGSTDPQGEALTYQWSFGDQQSGTGVSPVHSYTSLGTTGNGSLPETFKVTLTVTDTAGVSSTASTTATIAFPPPVVTINGPYSGRATLPVAFSSTVTNPLDDDWTYQWSFGDGTTSNVADPQHTYATAGTYDVTLLVVGQYQESTTVNSTAVMTDSGVGPSLSGVVQSGGAAVSGAHVYLLAANTTGYGQPSVSVLSGTGNADAVGSYVLSNGSGAFTLPGGFPCPTHEELYVYASGGAVGSNSNSGIGLMGVLGACGGLTESSSMTVNEATTVAAAFALEGYASGPTQVSAPNTAAAQMGIGNAFLNALNLASTAGSALTATPGGNGTAPQAKVDTLASILNGCVSTAEGSSACTALYGAVQPTGAADTATAAIDVAHNQGAGVAALYALLPESPAFLPVLSSAPHDWAMGISYKGVDQTVGLAVDGGGNVWALQYPTGYATQPHLTEFASNGTVQVNEDTICSPGGAAMPDAIAADTAGNVWMLVTSNEGYTDNNPNDPDYGSEVSYDASEYCLASPSGGMLAPVGGYSLGGSPTASVGAYDLALDANGDAWIPESTLNGYTTTGATVAGGGYVQGNTVAGLGVAIDGQGSFWLTGVNQNGIVKLTHNGVLSSPAQGYVGGGLAAPGPIAIDHNGNVWAVNTSPNYLYAGTSLSELSNTGQPLSGSGIVSSEMQDPYALAIDGAGNVWVANGAPLNSSNTVVEVTPGGSVAMYLSHTDNATAYLDQPHSIAVDETGSVWISDGNTFTVTQFVGAATPVVTPLAANLAAPYNAPASRP